MEELRIKEKIKASIAIGIISIAIIITALICIKYSVEGEKNIPFEVSKITVVSTAEGIENNQTENKWNLSVYQINDLYFSIEKNQELTENEIINSVSIENMKVTKNPNVGEVKFYMPNSTEGNLFSYTDEYQVADNKLTFKGASKSNSKTLEIGNQGGTIIMSIANTNLGNYISDEDEIINRDGKLISTVEKSIEDLAFEVNFDLVINMKNNSYVSNITLALPCENELIEKGTVNTEIKDNIVFKRARK